MSSAGQTVARALPASASDEAVEWARLTKAPDGTGEAALASIPTDWTVARLDALAKLVSGGTPSKKRPDWWRGSIPWASPKDMKRPKLRDTEDHVSQEAVEKGSRLVPAGTIFIVIRGMILAKDLPVAMAEVPMAFNQDMKAVLPGERLDGEYLLYALASRKRALAREISTSAHGTRRMGTASLESLLVPVPPLAEQRAIAAVLAKIQAAVEVQDKIVATLKELKAATMAKLFREGLRGEPLKQTEIGEIPESWDVVRVGELFEIQLGKMLSQKARRGIGARPYLRNANVQWGWLDLSEVYEMDFSDVEFAKFSLRPEDVLVCEGGEVGRAAVWKGEIADCCYQKALHRLRPKNAENVLPGYYVYWAMAAFAILRTHGVAGTKTTIAHLPAVKLAALSMALPGIEEQHEIVRTLQAVDARLDGAQARCTQLRSLFSSMLHLLMTGQVRANGSPAAITIGS
jgi:type I restriction enzyme, S subunit